ncbi:MAG: replication restart helicase PriA, partial [Nitrospirales bacterium]
GTSDIDLVDRFEGTPIATPDLHLVNLRNAPFGTVLSGAMQEGIADALAGRQGVLLFLNRRGFAPALLCRGCGQAPQCRRCSVTLTFHRRPGMLGCPYCGQSQGLPETCPACQAPQLEPVGFGTEQVEEEVRRRWPRARLVRLDRETAASTARAQAMRRLAGGGEFDIVIGTQMVLHGSCLPTVGFVGFPDADAGLHLPDFRAAERTYHALTDALSRLQATDGRGAAVLQTRLPSHHVIRAVNAGRPQIFYDEEMAYRRELGYPPFVHLISLAVSSPDPESARRGATTWATLVNEQTVRNGLGQDEVVVLGPVPAPLPRLRGRHRWHILVKGKDRNTTRDLVARTMPELPARAGTGGLKFDVDVDPVALM